MSPECSKPETTKPETTKPKFRIPLGLFLTLQLNDDSIDCCDTEIDNVICVETEIYHDEEFPLMEKCVRLIRTLVDVVGFNPVTVDISGLLHHNIDVIRPWVKENWKPAYAELVGTDDSGEWEFQFIESFNLIMAGHFGEKTHARYIQLLSQFKRVPAQSDEYVIVPANMGLTLPKDILGLWEQTVCEIRSEIKSWDLIGPYTEQYAISLCDKLEHSMCALAGGPYKLNYSIGD